jgi:uncharacterized membrane protein YoaT (DUF817 family)
MKCSTFELSIFPTILCDYGYYLLQLSNYPFSQLFYVTTVIIYFNFLTIHFPNYFMWLRLLFTSTF